MLFPSPCYSGARSRTPGRAEVSREMTAEAIPVATVDDAPVDSAEVETATVEDTASSDQQTIALAVRAAQYSRLEELREVRKIR